MLQNTFREVVVGPGGLAQIPSRTPPIKAQWLTLWQRGGAALCVIFAPHKLLCVRRLAGTVMWATVLPIDVAKTRIQTATPGSPRDAGILRNLSMLHREGMRSLTSASNDTLPLLSSNMADYGALRWNVF